MDNFIVSARKYRPSTFETLIGQDSIATTLKNSIKRGQLAHAYLFCGPRGVGKTTTARIFAKIINCTSPSADMEPCGECESCKSFEQGRSYCIHELDAASNNSVDDIRALTEKVIIPPQIGKYGVYIIDEVHMLSTAAFNAFLKTLEEPPAHAVFILATTEKQKIIPTILSRCQVYDFNRISIPDIVKNLKDIANKEDVIIDDNSLHVIAQKADGAMRDALTLFDQVVAYCGNEVTYEAVIKNLNVLDHEYYFNLIDYSLVGDFGASLVLFDQILSKGFNALYFVGGLSNHLRSLLLCKQTATNKLLETSEQIRAKYTEQAGRCSLKFLFKSLAICEKCESEYVRSNNQRLLVEFMLVRMSQLNESQDKPQIEPKVETEVKNGNGNGNENETVTKMESKVETEIKTETEIKKETETEKGIEIESKVETEIDSKIETEPKVKNVEVGGISISSLMEKTEQEEKDKKEENDTTSDKDALEFMGPSTNKEIAIEDLKRVWLNFADEFEKTSPKLSRFVAAVRQTEPIVDQDGTTVIFRVGNVGQKEWIEKYTANKIVGYLRTHLSNPSINLSVVKKSEEQVAQQMYLPEEKDKYMTEKNSDFKNLKDSLGAELLNK